MSSRATTRRAAAAALAVGFTMLCLLSLASIAQDLCAKHGGKLFDAGYGCLLADGTRVTVFSILSWPRAMITVLSYGVVFYVLWVRLQKRFADPPAATGSGDRP